MKDKKIAIKGAYGSGNFGDDALMYVVGCIVKKVAKEKNIIFICNRTLPYIYKMFPSAKFITRVDRTLSSDVLVYGGGTQFFSFPLTANTNNVHKRIMRNLNSPFLILKKIFNRIRYKDEINISKNRMALGVGVGPFVDGSQQKIQAHHLFSKLNYISVRDDSSLEYCKNWDFNSSLLRSDLCFMTEYFYPMLNEKTISKDIVSDIGIVVRDWSHTDEGAQYIERLPELSNKLREHGFKVTFVSFQTLGDKNVIEKLKDLNENILEWDVQTDSLSSFVNKLNSFDAFYSARYHGAIFSAILGKPVICVEVEQKLKLVSDLLGEGSRTWSHPFDVDNAINQLNDLTKDLSKPRKALSEAVSGQEILAHKMIKEFIKECS